MFLAKFVGSRRNYLKSVPALARAYNRSNARQSFRGNHEL